MYPVPDYAATFWVAGDNLMITFPPQRGEHSHTIKLPISEGGLKTAIQILKDRAHATDLRIANRGTPSQWEVENDARYKALVAIRRQEASQSRSNRSADDLLKELEL